MQGRTIRARLHALSSLAWYVTACVLLLALLSTNSSAQAPSTLATGVVRDAAGDPVPNAEVSFMRDERVFTRTTTDSEGRFRLHVYSATGLTLVVSARGFAEFKRWFFGPLSNTQDLDVVLILAPISERVVVTATRTETRVGETAASVASLSREEISTTAAATLDDALRQVAGFSLFRRSGSRTANPTSQGVSLRGVGASGASRAVVLADGVPLNDPFGGWVYWGRVPRAAVAGVEVLRGGASHLYGSGALGGVINITTRAPESPSLSLEASYGNQKTFDSSFFAGGRRGSWGASLSAEAFRTEGYVIVDQGQRGPVDVEAGAHYSVIKLNVDRSLSSSLKLFAGGSYFGEARSNGTPLQTNRTHTRQLTAGMDWQGARTGYFTLRAYGGTQLFDQNFTAVSADRSTEALTRLQRVPVQALGFSLQWSRALLKRHTLVAGFEGREVRGASDELAYVAGRPSSLVGAGGRERTTGLFLEDIVRVTEDLFITAGARVDRWRNYRALAVTRPLSSTAQSVTVFPDRVETAFSPQLSVTYRPRQSLSLYASAGRAFRQPTLNELYRSFRVGDVLTLSNENLRAERLTNGEAGAALGALGDRLNVRGTLFWSEISGPVANVTLRTQPGLITRQRQNLGRTRSRGAEVEWDARLGEHWALSGGYLFSDARVVRFPVNTALEGLLVPQVARHQLTFQARYANPSVLTVALQGRASGGQFDDDRNQFLLRRFFTLDGLVSRRLARGLDAFLAAENIFDQRYDVGMTPVRTVGPPLLVRVGFRLNLGAK